MEVSMNSLKRVLRMNAASCITFGLLGLLIPVRISTFLGDPPVWLIQVVGAVLMANGLHLILASQRPVLKKMGDFLFLVWGSCLVAGFNCFDCGGCLDHHNHGGDHHVCNCFWCRDYGRHADLDDGRS